MTHAERKALREKHLNLTTADGQFCVGCALISGRATYLDGLCDVIKVLDYLDLVEPMPEINWAGSK